jgi:hypothetical protein
MTSRSIVIVAPGTVHGFLAVIDLYRVGHGG